MLEIYLTQAGPKILLQLLLEQKIFPCAPLYIPFYTPNNSLSFGVFNFPVRPILPKIWAYDGADPHAGAHIY